MLTDNFTLGGICIKKNTKINTEDLRNRLKLQKKQELKSKTFFRGMKKFEDCICKPKLNLILDWILDNAYIHYTDIDGLYFTIIDIVDSVCDTEIGKKLPISIIEAFKSELYILLRENIISFWDLCMKTNYPNVLNKDIYIFCNGLINIIENNEDHREESLFTLEIFRQLIKDKMNDEELVFLSDNEEKTIMNCFYSLRQQRCIIFKNSYHIFDNEVVDEEKMENASMVLNNGNILRNFEFRDSKLDIKLQISDIIIYLISKYLKFLTYNTSEEVDDKIKNMSKQGKENLGKFIKLINKSDIENSFFIETITAQQINFIRNVMHKHIEFLVENKFNTNM